MKTKEQIQSQIAKLVFYTKQTRDEVDTFTDIRADKTRQNLTRALILIEEAETWFNQIEPLNS